MSFLLDKKFFLSLNILVCVSNHSSLKPVSSKQVASKIGISVRYAELLMQKLVKSGVLKGIRGAGGGYVLAKDRRKISLFDIYESVEDFDDGSSSSKLLVYNFNINKEIDSELKKISSIYLSKVSLDEIYDRAIKSNLNINNFRSDFVI